MSTNRDLAEAFSGHRFAEAYDALADDVVWAVPGQTTLRGRAAVIAACEETWSSMVDTEARTLRFLVCEGDDAVAIDSVTRYTDPAGSVSVVSSGDFYEFAGGRIVAVTSYAVELDAADPGSTARLRAD